MGKRGKRRRNDSRAAGLAAPVREPELASEDEEEQEQEHSAQEPSGASRALPRIELTPQERVSREDSAAQVQQQQQQQDILSVPLDEVAKKREDRLVALSQSARANVATNVILGAETQEAVDLLRNTAINSLTSGDSTSSLQKRMDELKEREAVQLRGLQVASMVQQLMELHAEEERRAGGSTNPFAALLPDEDEDEEAETASDTSSSDSAVGTSMPASPQEGERFPTAVRPGKEESNGVTSLSSAHPSQRVTNILDEAATRPVNLPARPVQPSCLGPSHKRSREGGDGVSAQSTHDEGEPSLKRVRWGSLSYVLITETSD